MGTTYGSGTFAPFSAQIFREEFTPIIEQGLDLVTETLVNSSVKTTMNRIRRIIIIRF